MAATTAAGLVLTGCDTMSAHKTATASAEPEANGSRLWAQNCIRCHNSKPSTTYSDAQWEVAMLHMRIRANLTGREEKQILAFLKSGD